MNVGTIARVFGVVVAAACSSTPAPNPSTDDGQLGTISGDEIVGTLTYGQTSAPVTYTSVPRYRAFSFDGANGDAVHIVVHSTDGLAMAWVQDNASQTVGYDATGSSDAVISATLASSGTYLIVFREAALQTATFTVSLALAPVISDAGDAATDVAMDAIADSPTADVGGDADGATESGSTASCTFTRTLTGANGCSLCVLPAPVTSTDPLTFTIDNAGGGAKDNQINGGTGRTLHLNGVSNEISSEGCFLGALALDGTPPSESWQLSNGAASTYCSNLVGNVSGSVTVMNSTQVSMSLNASTSPGITNCAIIHGCVIESLSCSGTGTAQ
jgi:hypothetical protein